MRDKILTLTVFILLLTLNVQSQDITTFPYFTGFEGIASNLSEDFPSGWTSEDLNTVQFGNQGWQIIKNTSFSQNAHTDSTAVHMFSHMTEQNNDWLFTPSIQMQAGHQYKMSFWYKCNQVSGSSEKLAVYAGTQNNAATMLNSDPLWENQSITNTEYQLAEVEFTPAADGVFYFAFYYFSDPFQFILLVDDVTIEDLGTNSISIEHAENGMWVINPVQNEIIINGCALNASTVQLYDIAGRIIFQTRFQSDRFVKSRDGIGAGIYFLRVFSEGKKELYSGKIILN